MGYVCHFQDGGHFPAKILFFYILGDFKLQFFSICESEFLKFLHIFI